MADGQWQATPPENGPQLSRKCSQPHAQGLGCYALLWGWSQPMTYWKMVIKVRIAISRWDNPMVPLILQSSHGLRLRLDWNWNHTALSIIFFGTVLPTLLCHGCLLRHLPQLVPCRRTPVWGSSSRKPYLRGKDWETYTQPQYIHLSAKPKEIYTWLYVRLKKANHDHILQLSLTILEVMPVKTISK